MSVITYYFTPQSPWTYLGHERFARLVERFQVAVELRPIDLLRVFRVSGGLPLSERPQQRRDYRLTELKRFSEHLDIPLSLHPLHFPVSGDLASKTVLAAERRDGVAAAFKLAGRFGRACWADQENIADGDTLARLAAAQGLDGAALVREARTEVLDAVYQTFTDEAIEVGVFGAPTFRLDGELFWGQDRLEFVEKSLAHRAKKA